MIDPEIEQAISAAVDRVMADIKARQWAAYVKQSAETWSKVKSVKRGGEMSGLLLVEVRGKHFYVKRVKVVDLEVYNQDQEYITTLICRGGNNDIKPAIENFLRGLDKLKELTKILRQLGIDYE